MGFQNRRSDIITLSRYAVTPTEKNMNHIFVFDTQTQI